MKRQPDPYSMLSFDTQPNYGNEVYQKDIYQKSFKYGIVQPTLDDRATFVPKRSDVRRLSKKPSVISYTNEFEMEKNKINQKVNSQCKPIAQIIHSKNRKVDNNYDYKSENNELKVNIPKNTQRPVIKKQVLRDDKNQRKEETRSVLMIPNNYENLVKSESRSLQKEEKKYINKNGILRHEQPLAQNERYLSSQIDNFGIMDSNSVRSNIRTHVKDGKMDLAAYEIPQQSIAMSQTHRLRASDLIGSRNRGLNNDTETYEIEPTGISSSSRAAINIRKQMLQDVSQDIGDNVDVYSNSNIRNNIIKKTQSIQNDNINHQLPQETAETRSIDRSNVNYQHRNLDKNIEDQEISAPIKTASRFYLGKEMKRTFDKNQSTIHTETAANSNFRELNYKDERKIENLDDVRDGIEINPSESKTYLGVESHRSLNIEKLENNIDVTPSNYDVNREFTRKRERVVVSAELTLDEVDGPNIDRQERRFIQKERALDPIDNDEYDGCIDINSHSLNRNRIIQNKQKLEDKPTQEFLVHNNQSNIRTIVLDKKNQMARSNMITIPDKPYQQNARKREYQSNRIERDIQNNDINPTF